MKATAIIVEDEPLLARGLQLELAQQWPELEVIAFAADGLSAQSEALCLKPDVLFLDIQIPGQSGIELAIALAEEWPGDTPFPALVFVTAFERYAVQAFDQQATDYLLKPISSDRLRQTVARVQRALHHGETVDPSRLPDSIANRRALQGLLDVQRAEHAGLAATAAVQPLLRIIQASAQRSDGSTHIQMIPIDQVLCFQAADKYVRVLTRERECLIRTPLRELLEQLDAGQFWQIHRNSVVRADSIAQVVRDASGKMQLSVHGLTETLVVSRLYAHRFKAM